MAIESRDEKCSKIDLTKRDLKKKQLSDIF